MDVAEGRGGVVFQTDSSQHQPQQQDQDQKGQVVGTQRQRRCNGPDCWDQDEVLTTTAHPNDPLGDRGETRTNPFENTTDINEVSFI